MSHPFKIATVPYLNGLPLTAWFESGNGPSSKILRATPTDLVALLQSGLADVALSSVVAAWRHGLLLYPECGVIGCDGPVGSVGFFLKPDRTLENLRSLYLDHESQSASQLARIILERFLKRPQDEIVIQSYDERDTCDAQLLIGDKALFPKLPGRRYEDLGEIWHRHTGLGFVFACWAAVKPLSQEQQTALLQAREWGFSHMDRILASIPAERLQRARDYLKQDIRYTLTPALTQGMALFREHLRIAGFL